MEANKDTEPVRSLKRRLEEILQCTVCYKTKRTTALQCPNGHITCEKCAEQSPNPNCPVCREPLNKLGKNKRIRCLVVEQGPNLIGSQKSSKNRSKI